MCSSGWPDPPSPMLPLALLAALGAAARPTHAPLPRAMTSAQLSELAPYTQFARAAYCSPSIVQGWACGRMSLVLGNPIRLTPLAEACQAVPGFQASLTGGDGNAIQYCNNIFASLPALTVPLQTMLDIGPPPTPSSSLTRALTPPNCNLTFPSCIPFVHPFTASPTSPMPTSSCKALILPSFPA